MALNGVIKLIAGPAYLANAVANIYTPASSDVYTVITQIHIANVTAGAVTWTAYIGGTGGSTGGTEIAKGVSIAANSVVDYPFYPGLKLTSTQFLSGLASAATSLTITVSGYYVAS